MSHYFINDTTLKQAPRIIEFELNNFKIVVLSDKGTFSKYRVDLGTRIFISKLISLPLKGDILDLGCGNGVVGIFLKKYFKNINVEFSDINIHCVNLTLESLKLNNIEAKVYNLDGLKDISKSFDYILLNSPISAGKDICYKLYKESKDKLNEKGNLIIVIRKDKGALSHMKELETLFKEVEVIKKEKGYFVISCSL